MKSTTIKLLFTFLFSLGFFCGVAQQTYNYSGPTINNTPFLRTVDNGNFYLADTIHYSDAGGSLRLNTWSSSIELPFNFTFFGADVTHFCISKNGLITFDTSVALKNVSPQLRANTALPNADLPNNTIAFFWNDFLIVNSNDDIYMKVEGTAPNRQLYIYPQGLRAEYKSYQYIFLVLEETTNNIYMIDGWNDNAQATLTVGLQKDVHEYVEMPGSPYINTTSTGMGISDDKHYKFSPINLFHNDIELYTIDSPAITTCDLESLIVSVRNAGLDAIDTANINISINGNLVKTKGWSGTLPRFGLTQINIDSVTLQHKDVLKIWVDNPNNAIDSNNLNDTFTRVVYEGMSGVYTIGKNGADFNSFTNAVAALNDKGVCSHVIFEVDSADSVYYEQIKITPITGAGKNATVTFKGNGAIITYAASSFDSNYIIELDGADYITFDGLNIFIDSANYANQGRCVHLQKGADHNTIKNCTLKSSLGHYNSLACVISQSEGIAADNATTGSYNMFIGNIIIGGRVGIEISADRELIIDENSYEFLARGIVIKDNIIRDFQYEGLDLWGLDSSFILNNDISGPTRTTPRGFIGIHMYNICKGVVVNGNRIHNPLGPLATVSANYHATGMLIKSIVPITHANEANIISNNAIYDFNTLGRQTGIEITYVKGNYIIHNTIVLDDNELSNQNTSAISYLPLNTNEPEPVGQLYNNMLYVTRNTTALNAVFWYEPLKDEFFIDNNVYYLPKPPNGSRHLGDPANITPPYLFSWQTDSTDTASIYYNAQFLDPANGDFTLTSDTLFGIGKDNIYVGTDINGKPRDLLNPDPGAFEENFDSVNVQLQLILNPETGGCGTDSVDVELRLRNVGILDTLEIPVTFDINGDLNFTYNDTIRDIINLGETKVYSFDNIFSTRQGGNYTLTIYTSVQGDTNYANDTLIKHLQYDTVPNNPLIIDRQVCRGDSITIYSATNVGYIDWFTAPSSTPYIHRGDSLTFNNVKTDTSFYLRAIYKNCPTDKFSVTLKVNPLPGSSFTTTIDSAVLEGTVDTIVSGVEYYWDFGDNSNTIGDSVTHAYDTTGTYIVSLLATDSLTSCFTKTEETVNITVVSTNYPKVILGKLVVYPNPFKESTQIKLSLNYEADIKIEVLDALGRKVTDVAKQHCSAGEYSFEYTSIHSEGIYYIHVYLNGNLQVIKILDIE